MGSTSVLIRLIDVNCVKQFMMLPLLFVFSSF
jgi:hypothetical protein